MEELAILTCMAAAAMVWGLVLFIADLCGFALGLGWRHFSKGRATGMAEPKHD
jgi:hypothetical protein